MTNQIGINQNEKQITTAKLKLAPSQKEQLVKNLQYFCQKIYLATNPIKKYNSVNDIIHDFLNTIKSDFIISKDSCKTKQTKLPGIYGISPAYAELTDIQNWKVNDIMDYNVISRISNIKRLFSLQTTPWSSNESYSFSKEIERFLNQERFVNGRIRIIIELNTNKDVTKIRIIYNRNVKSITFLIPNSIKNDIQIQFNSILNESIDISYKSNFDDIIFLNKTNEYNSYYNIDLDLYKNNLEILGFEGKEGHKKLALNILLGALKHIVFLDNNVSLVYIFSNNAIYINDEYIKEGKYRDVGLGGLFVILNKSLLRDENGDDDDTVIKFLSRISDTLANRIVNYYQVKQVLLQSLRAAISQVMARNMSHNIGSHVMNKLVRGLSDINFNTNNYQESIFNLIDHHDNQMDCFTDNKPLPKCVDLTLAQIEFFNAYIKNRMEYLGDMAMNTPMMSSSKSLINDIFKDFDKVRLLLDNISGLDEKFKFKFRFVINGTIVTKDNFTGKDIQLAIANDVTGCQAFYNILENIIRNTAKHSSASTVTFTVDVRETESKFGDEATEFFQINVYDDVEKEDILERLYSQNDILNRNLIEESTNNLRQGSLGMIEMDASAAYLRMLEISDINKDEFEIRYDNLKDVYVTQSGKLPILNANKYCKENAQDAKCLGYQFYIAKPKEILFVLDNKGEIIENKTKGIDIILKTDFVKKLNQKKAFPHQFVVTDFNLDDEIKKHKAQFSPRVLILKRNEIELLCDNGELIQEVWKIWTQEKLGQNQFFSFCFDMPAAEGNNLVFTDHSLNLVGINGNYLEPKKFITYESLSSLAQSKMPFFSNLSREGENEPLFNYVNRVSDKNRHFIIKNILGGAALNKIFVLDERIQQFSREIYTYNGYSALHYAMYQAMNIFMPYPKFYKNSDETNRLRQTFEYDLNCEKLGEDLINQINTSLCKIKPKFIVIHYGILERIFGKNKENKIPVILNEWAKKFSDSDIIITSGRTRLEGLPTNVRFLNLAPLLTAFIDVRSKYLIDKILNDSRI